ncbi:MAG: hypothetical protein HY521_15440 [Proteobacteria bacterium]|nr:hypothetical protein [Pseudomonadota bacterium]
MPIHEKDPWRRQYFEGVACPEGIEIPTDDGDAFRLYPAERWIYNKLLLAESQGLAAAPHGVDPLGFPVFSKPIYNLRGMGTGTRVIESRADYERLQQPGHMWMPVLAGEHLSSDVALVKGEARWWRHTRGVPLGGGMFDRWTVMAEPMPAIEAACGAWLGRHLDGYSGMANLETIGGVIIDLHLRLSDQWVDLNGPGWMESVVALYATGRWEFADSARRTGHSVVLFGPHGLAYNRSDPELIAELRARPGISSIQITFHEDKPPETHAMPPGGFRLAIVNGWDLAAGLETRARLALMFWPARRLARPRRAAPPARARARRE